MARLTFESRARVVRAVPATIHLSRSTARARQVAALGQGLAPVRPAVGGQPQADGVGDGLGNVESGRIGHPRGDPLVVIRVVRTHYPGPVPARTTPRPILPAPPRRSPPLNRRSW